MHKAPHTTLSPSPPSPIRECCKCPFERFPTNPTCTCHSENSNEENNVRLPRKGFHAYGSRPLRFYPSLSSLLADASSKASLPVLLVHCITNTLKDKRSIHSQIQIVHPCGPVCNAVPPPSLSSFIHTPLQKIHYIATSGLEIDAPIKKSAPCMSLCV